MTMGVWICVKCGYGMVIPIYAPPSRCPKCGAEYELVKMLVGAHIAHAIPVMRLKGTDILAVVGPIAFAVGPDEEAFEEYLSIWRRQYELGMRAREAKDK